METPASKAIEAWPSRGIMGLLKMRWWYLRAKLGSSKDNPEVENSFNYSDVEKGSVWR